MKLSEFISEAKKHIETSWVQRAYRSHGRVCAISALERTAMAHLSEGGPALVPKAKRLLENKIVELHPEVTPGGDLIPAYNDDVTTTHDDVLALFTKVQLECEEKDL